MAYNERRGLDLGIPLGDTVAHAPIIVGAPGAFLINGVPARDMFLERLIVNTQGVFGLVTECRVARQNVIQSDQGFPLSMLFPGAQDDQSNSLGLPLKGSLTVEVSGTLDAACTIGGFVGVAAWPPGIAPEVISEADFDYVYGLGEVINAAAGAFTLQGRALRDVYLGRMVLETTDPLATINSIEVGGSEMISGDGSILLDTFNQAGTDEDGYMLNKRILAGETVTIQGNTLAVGPATVRGGIFLLDNVA